MQSPVLATVGMSVRPSVLLSVCQPLAGTMSKRHKLYDHEMFTFYWFGLRFCIAHDKLRKLVYFITDNIAVTLHRLQRHEEYALKFEQLTLTLSNCSNTLTSNKATCQCICTCQFEQLGSSRRRAFQAITCTGTDNSKQT